MNAATEVLRPDDEGVEATKKVGRWGGYNLVQGSIWGPDEILSIEGKQKWEMSGMTVPASGLVPGAFGVL